jgi:DNA-binding transcriptional regulator YdaS (Cro superfamily)
MTLAEYLYDARLSNSEFGARVGVSHTTVGRWIAGEVEPRGKTILEIVRASDGRVSPAKLSPRTAAESAAFAEAEQLHRRCHATAPSTRTYRQVASERAISARGM